MIGLILDLLFPKTSLSGDEGEFVTENERQKLMKTFPVKFTKEALQRQGITFIDGLIAAGTYESTPLLRKAILTFKYGRIPDLHTDLGLLITNALPGLFFADPGVTPVICPVPLHWTRRFSRGFNQSLLLAKVIESKTGWPTKELLKRIRPTGHQAHRNRQERLTALKDAFRFQARTNPLVPEHVILADDLCTTGSTLKECAKELKRAGVKRVDAMVVAHG